MIFGGPSPRELDQWTAKFNEAVETVRTSEDPEFRKEGELLLLVSGLLMLAEVDPVRTNDMLRRVALMNNQAESPQEDK